jgi:hypothetical protein
MRFTVSSLIFESVDLDQSATVAYIRKFCGTFTSDDRRGDPGPTHIIVRALAGPVAAGAGEREREL